MGAHEIKRLPEDRGTEIAVSGRSNAGKSSVINVIVNNSGLARTSKSPGRTQQINIFSVDEQRRLVDLPGYGYAKVSYDMRRHWAKTINKYFQTRHALSGLLLVVDIRRSLNLTDKQHIDWSLQVGLPIHILLNKSDKLSRSQASKLLDQIRQDIDHNLVSIQLFSALKHTGVKQVRAVLDRWFGYQ